jgi:hypothetical protein
MAPDRLGQLVQQDRQDVLARRGHLAARVSRGRPVAAQRGPQDQRGRRGRWARQVHREQPARRVQLVVAVPQALQARPELKALLEHRALRGLPGRLDQRDRRGPPAASERPEPLVLQVQVHHQMSCR